MLPDHVSTTKWECELQGDDVTRAGVSFVTLEGIHDADLEADVHVKSGVTTALFEDAVFLPNGKLKISKEGKVQGNKRTRERTRNANKRRVGGGGGC